MVRLFAGRSICARWNIVCLVTVVISSSNLFAEDQSIPSEQEIIITASKIEKPKSQVASSVTVITESEIQNQGITETSQAIEQVAGVDLAQSGGAGGNTVAFIRGANSEHTLVLIDGVEANNPVTPNRAFNFSSLPLDNIDRIEVLRGPQSTIYGSDALGGVINIITKRGRGEPKAFASFEGGSFDSFIEKTGVNGALNIFDYSFGFSREDTQGISAASEDFGNRERDGHNNSSFSSRLGVEPIKELYLSGTIRYEDGRSELDNDGGIGGDDPNRILDNQQLFIRAEASAKLFDERLIQKYGISYSNQKYEDNNDPDPLNPLDLLRSDFAGRMLKLDWQNSVPLSDQLTLIAGIETEQELGSSNYYSESEFGPFTSNFPEKDARTNGYFSQAELKIGEAFASSFGIRVDDHSEFGSELTYRIAPTYSFIETGTKVSATVGTGFKAPSLYQLYSDFGNRELEPEKSLGIDAGIEQSLIRNRLTVGATWFWNDFTNLITFNPDTFILENITDAKSSGIELFSNANLNESLSVGLNYTFTDTEDESTGLELLRRARNKLGANLNYKPVEQVNLNLGVHYIGKRADNDFSGLEATRVELSGYTLVSARVSYDLSPTVQLFARVENAFDKQYEQVYGFGTEGVAGFGGIKVSL